MRTLVLITALAGVVSCGERPVLARGANVLLITLDTVRADHLGVYGYEAARTPNLDGLAGDGALFESAMAVAPRRGI